MFLLCMKTNNSLLKWEEFPFFNLKIWSYINFESLMYNKTGKTYKS